MCDKIIQFEHPCDNVLRAEEKFFYNPDLPNVDTIIVKDIKYCNTCAWFSENSKTLIGMCQGLEIKVAIDERTSYNK